MRMHQQIQALASENETLKQQNNILLASQDAYKNAFKILAASISLDLCDSDIAKFAGIPPGFKSAVYKPSFRRSEPLCQNDYPKMKFWTPSLYEAWKKSPSAQYTEHGTFPFLKNTDGKPNALKLVMHSTCRVFAPMWLISTFFTQVSDDIWNGNTVDIIGRFSSGVLY
ncbi:hypothetical protein EDB19DRAFT_1668215 [Suillus lakei]|nr:hypothetical protein EDB19DRAFT_1668215 [Suillus lakei]